MIFLEKISHCFCWIIGKTLFTFFFDFRVIGAENLKNLRGPLIVAFNHNSWLDPFLVMASVPPNSKITPIHFATWYKHYWKFFPFTFISGAFPVKKKLGLKKSLKKGLELLKKKGVVGIAPEERRRYLGRPRKGRRGAAFLALKTNTPILPIYIEGSLGLKKPNFLFLLKKRKVRIVIGKNFYLQEWKIKKTLDLNAPANFIVDKIYQLKPKN